MISKFQHNTPTVLIVDDNLNNVKIIAITLRPLNYKIVIATNGKSAIEMVERTKPDIVLLDIMMPVMDGYETCKIIKSKKENENIPIIFLTGLSEKDSIVKGFDAGGVDYITKPFNKDELISRVKTHLELKYTQDELLKTTKHLSELNALKDKMFSIIGHDLRSPLGSVKMILEFLSETVSDSSDDEFKSTFDLLLKTTDEVFSLLENLLGWAKAQSGNLAINKEEIYLADLVTEIHQLYNGNLVVKNITLVEDIEIQTTIFADLYTMKSVLRNLVSNAIKFTPDNGTIKVSSKETDGNVIVEITDSGVGISAENLPKLFDSTQHFTTFGTNRESGSGLGLLLCHDFILLNGGTIGVKSEPEKGTSFFVSIPVSAGDEN